jgi:hypothetical protein
MEAIHSSETSVHTRSTRRHIPEDGILHSHSCETVKSYIIYSAPWIHEHRLCLPIICGAYSKNWIDTNERSADKRNMTAFCRGTFLPPTNRFRYKQ